MAFYDQLQVPGFIESPEEVIRMVCLGASLNPEGPKP